MVGAAGLLAFVLKACVPILAGQRELSPRVVAVTGLVAPAVVGALLASSLVESGPSLDLARRLPALLVGFVVAVRTGSVPATIGSGIAVHLAVGLLP